MNVRYACWASLERDERMDAMAQHVIDALAEILMKGTAWRGESAGACPVCHQSMFRVHPDSDLVECAICGIEGHVSARGGKRLSIHFPKNSRHVRFFMAYADSWSTAMKSTMGR